MKTAIKFASVAAVLSFALVGCSGNAQETAAGASSATPVASQTPSDSPTKALYDLQQTFAATTTDGAKIAVDFTAEAPADAESLRASLGAEPVAYAKVVVDNREGSERVGAYPVTVYDTEGNAYEFEDLPNVVGDWGDEAISSGVYNDYLNLNNVDPLQQGGGYLASLKADLPEKVTGVVIQAYGGDTDPVYLTPAPETAQDDPSSPAPSEAPVAPPVATQQAEKNVREMTNQEAYDAYARGELTEVEYCSRDSWLTSGAAQTCHFVNNPDAGPDAPTEDGFTYDEAYAAWQNGMSYWDAFCVNYTPTTDGGRSQCEGIQMGTVDHYTGEYVGDQIPSIPEGQGFGCHKDENGNDYCIDPAPGHIP